MKDKPAKIIIPNMPRHDDTALQEHFETCQRTHEQMERDGTWPWPSEFHDTMSDERDARPSRPNAALSKESLRAMEELGLVLKEVYLSLKKKGFHISDGKLIAPPEYEQYDQSRTQCHQGD